jgi:hypothetical protein
MYNPALPKRIISNFGNPPKKKNIPKIIYSGSKNSTTAAAPLPMFLYEQSSNPDLSPISFLTLKS